ncbi:MAG TPA: hypothetical protein VGE41_05430 [Verrucomicrobiae bacterium]
MISFFSGHLNRVGAAYVKDPNIICQEFIVLLKILPASDEASAHIGFRDVMPAGPNSIGNA